MILPGQPKPSFDIEKTDLLSEYGRVTSIAGEYSFLSYRNRSLEALTRLDICSADFIGKLRSISQTWDLVFRFLTKHSFLHWWLFTGNVVSCRFSLQLGG